MHLVLGHDATVNAWVALRYGVHVQQQPSVSMGVINRDGVLVGAFVLTAKNDTTAELHLYGKTSNDTWREMFARVFGSGVYRLEIRTAKSNRAVKKAAPKFGFKFEGVERDYYGRGQDALRFYMTPEACRWLKRGDHGLVVQVS